MSTTILSTTRACDGWDVLTDYRGLPFHSTIERADWQAWVDAEVSDMQERQATEATASEIEANMQEIESSG